MENDSLCVLFLKPEPVLKMPCNGLSLTVFIACQIDGFRLVCKSLEICNNFFLVCRNLIVRLEPVFYVYAQ